MGQLWQPFVTVWQGKLRADTGKVELDTCDFSDGFHDSFARISSRRSVRQKELFVRSFSRVSGSGESFSESFRLTSSLRPSFSFANRECQPSRSDSLPPSVPRSRSRIVNASRVGQTRLLPRSQHSNESQMHNAVLTAESVSVRLPRSHFSNESRNHDSQSCNGANGYQSTQH